MDKYTFGDSRAAINLMVDILGKPEYEKYSSRVAKLLSKQFQALNAVAEIRDKTIREATLQMWHRRFIGLAEDLPEVIKTHTLCVAAGKYHQLLGDKIYTK